MSETERLIRLDGQIDALKVVRPMTITVVSVVPAALVFGIGFLGLQVQATNATIEAVDARLSGKIDAVDAKLSSKIDAIPQQLAAEFRAMRAKMSAQTAAIAESIPATTQQVPQVILMQAPTPGK